MGNLWARLEEGTMKTVFKAGIAAALACAGIARSLPPLRREHPGGHPRVHRRAQRQLRDRSVRQLDCNFRPSVRGAKAGKYAATVRRFGLDVGISGQQTLVWGVLAPTRRVSPATSPAPMWAPPANAAVGLGVGSQCACGGLAQLLHPAPVSVEGGTGLNVGLTVSDLTLTAR